MPIPCQDIDGVRRFMFCFFFQAEDGIRDYKVTGVQTCALPIFKGLRQPALSGMSSSTSVRNTYSTAAMHTARGALKLLVCWALVPEKSMTALRPDRKSVV